MDRILPISTIIPTKDRSNILKRTLDSLFLQSFIPKEIIIIDASLDDSTEILIGNYPTQLDFELIWLKADEKGAAVQRTQGVDFSKQPFILFMDDDILLEQDCLSQLWFGIQENPRIGGVNAMITNQQYGSPGKLSMLLYYILSGEKRVSYAGKCIGPALNLLPEDKEDLPNLVCCDWLNLGCTLYRKEALPNPVFHQLFQGYSLFEDVSLSLKVGENWELYNARKGKIFHDSQPGSHKSNVVDLAKMKLINRHYIMTEILGRNSWKSYLRLLFFEIFQLATSLRSLSDLGRLPKELYGRLLGLFYIINSWKESGQKY